MPFSATEQNNEAAAKALTDLESEMDADEYATAFQRGSLRPYDVAAKELIGR